MFTELHQIMLVYFLAAVFLTTVEGCVVTGHKPVGAACNCSDACLGNSQCQHDGHGGFACLCLICQYYDSNYRQCVDILDPGTPCNGQCGSNLVCAGQGVGAGTCQCPPDHYYDERTRACINTPGAGDSCRNACLSNLVCINGTCQCGNNFEWDSEGRCSPVTSCVSNIYNGCVGLPNGDYPACFPECQQGIFITCSNGYRYVRDCALGWYVRPSGQRFTEKLVYDPMVKRCERKASYCPRSLDNLIEGK